MLSRKQKGIISLIALGLVGITLIVLPADFFDQGQAMCVSVLLFDTECYGCGMTRAVQHLIHLDFQAAADFNKLSFIVFPLLVYMILWEIWTRFFKKES